MSWGEFLWWASSPGINSIVGAVLSFLAVYIPGYEALQAKWKRLVFFAICMIVPLGATAAAITTGEWGVWNDWAGTWWPAVVAGFSAGSAGTLFHTRKLW